MKKILITLLAATFFVSCKNEDYTISGEVKGYNSKEYVYLEIQKDNNPKTIDSLRIKDGKFEFKGKADSLDIAFIKIPSLQCMMPFVLENGSIKITINKDSLANSKISGTENNDDLQKFNDDINVLNKKLYDFSKKNQQKYIEASSKNDLATVEKLTTEASKIQKEYTDFPKKYIKENTNFISLIILENFATRGQMPVSEAKSNFEKFPEDLKNSKSGTRINKVISPTAEKKK
jgi:hypothetical protein